MDAKKRPMTTNTTFVKQATQSLIPPNIRKVSNTITDLAGKADIILQGGDIGKPANKPNNWIQHVRLNPPQPEEL
jgi:hypothetical protein